MPAVMEYLPPNVRKSNAYATAAHNEREKRRKQYNTAYKYYIGEQDQQLDEIENEPNDNTVINVTKTIIDREVSFIFADMPSFKLDLDEADNSPLEKWLDDVFYENGGLSFLNILALQGALSGHTFARVLQKTDQYDYPRVVPVDPNTISVYWKADDPQTVIFYTIEWTIGGNEYALDFVNNAYIRREAKDEFKKLHELALIGSHIVDVVVGSPLLSEPSMVSDWSIIQYSSISNIPSNFKVDEFEAWASELSPIVDVPHIPNPRSYYGWSSAEPDSKKSQDSINLVMSEIMRIIRYHASPRTIASGADADDIVPTSVRHMWAVPSDVKIENLEMQSDLAASHTTLQFMYDQMLAQQRVVLLRGEVKDFQRVTNTGVSTVFMDMLAKNKVLRHQYSRLLQGIASRLAVVGGKGALKPRIAFVNPLPLDRSEDVATNALEVKTGFKSRQEVIVEDGRNPDTVFTQLDEEQERDFMGGGNEPEITEPDIEENLTVEEPDI